MMKNSKAPKDVLPDTLTQRIGVLTRREVEARILSPLIEPEQSIKIDTAHSPPFWYDPSRSKIFDL